MEHETHDRAQPIEAADVAALARVGGLLLPPGDLERLAAALAGHAAAIAPLLEQAEWSQQGLLTHDPRWRDG